MAFALRKVLLSKHAFLKKYFKNSSIVTTVQNRNPVGLSITTSKHVKNEPLEQKLKHHVLAVRMLEQQNSSSCKSPPTSCSLLLHAVSVSFLPGSQKAPIARKYALKSKSAVSIWFAKDKNLNCSQFLRIQKRFSNSPFHINWASPSIHPYCSVGNLSNTPSSPTKPSTQQTFSETDSAAKADSVAKADSSAKAHRVAKADSVANAGSVANADSVANAVSAANANSIVNVDSIVNADSDAKADSAAKEGSAAKADSTAKASLLLQQGLAAKVDYITKADSAAKADTAAKADSAAKTDCAAKVDSTTKAHTAAKADSATKPDIYTHSRCNCHDTQMNSLVFHDCGRTTAEPHVTWDNCQQRPQTTLRICSNFRPLKPTPVVQTCMVNFPYSVLSNSASCCGPCAPCGCGPCGCGPCGCGPCGCGPCGCGSCGCGPCGCGPCGCEPCGCGSCGACPWPGGYAPPAFGSCGCVPQCGPCNVGGPCGPCCGACGPPITYGPCPACLGFVSGPNYPPSGCNPCLYGCGPCGPCCCGCYINPRSNRPPPCSPQPSAKMPWSPPEYTLSLKKESDLTCNRQYFNILNNNMPKK